MSSQDNEVNRTRDADELYYVEDVGGSDFTFYLPLEPNSELLWEASQGNNPVPSREFSKVRTIRLIKLPPLLTKRDLIYTPLEFQTRVSEALAANPQNDATTLIGKLCSEIAPEKRCEADTLVQEFLKVINKVLGDDNGEVLINDVSEEIAGSDFHEDEIISRFSDASGLFCRNRRKLDRILPGVFKPFKLQDNAVHGRALICSSYRGNFLSVSFREKNERSSFEPSADKGDWPLSMKDYCDTLGELIEQVEMQGLLVIAGATNTAKSEIATGLIFNYLKKPGTDKRRPHLVTFEDPIEKFYARFNDSPETRAANSSKLKTISVALPALEMNLDYTPRERDKDYSEKREGDALKKALEDALRQTPSVFFVGETRKRKDWRHIIDFAGTGHLIVTTTHAESLTEAMRKIFEALDVKTASQRNEIASRLLGIVHLRPDGGSKMVLPALWRRTTMGRNTLTAEGLSSLLPHRPRPDRNASVGDNIDEGCLGRTWLVTQLLKRTGRLTADEQRALISLATTWDLEGV